MFVDGNINVSDLTVNASAVPATQPWPIEGSSINMLLEVLGFRGKHAMQVSIDRIRLEGASDNLPSDWGVNAMNGAHFTGELPKSDVLHDYYFLSGSLTVHNSYFTGFAAGVSQDGFVTSSNIVIGGSPSAGNHFENNYVGTDIEASEKSMVEVSYNESSSNAPWAAIWVVPWLPELSFPARSHPLTFLIHDNKCSTTTPNGEGIFSSRTTLQIPGSRQRSGTTPLNCKTTSQKALVPTTPKSTVIWNNSVAGLDGSDAIGLHGQQFQHHHWQQCQRLCTRSELRYRADLP